MTEPVYLCSVVPLVCCLARIMPVYPRCHYAQMIKSTVFVVSLAVTATHSILTRLDSNAERLKHCNDDLMSRFPLGTQRVPQFLRTSYDTPLTARASLLPTVTREWRWSLPPPSLSPRTRALVSRLCAKFSLSFSHPKIRCVCTLKQVYTMLTITVLCAFFRFSLIIFYKFVLISQIYAIL